MADMHLVHDRSQSVPVVPLRARQQSDFEEVVWPYRLILPLMMVIAFYVCMKKKLFAALNVRVKTNFYFVDGMSINSRRVKDGSARWPALDACYNYRAGEGSTRLLRSIDHFWMQVRNAQAVRNRLIIVKRELRNALTEATRSIGGDEPVRLLSLAAGAAQGVIEVISELRSEGIKVRAILIDRDKTALRYARDLAARYGLEKDIEVKEGDVVFFNRLTRGFEPHVVEMCGLMDYLPTTLAEKLVRKIWLTLAKDGFFLTCHVHPNSETYFLRYVVDWDMIYRPLNAFRDILISGNFLAPRFVTEPHNIHSVAIARKR